MQDPKVVHRALAVVVGISGVASVVVSIHLWDAWPVALWGVAMAALVVCSAVFTAIHAVTVWPLMVLVAWIFDTNRAAASRSTGSEPRALILKSGVLYFALVFGAGFMLGTVRVLWVVPQLGTRAAELIETPVMLVVIIVSAKWLARRGALPSAPARQLAVGLVALGLLVGAELTLVLGLQGSTIGEYVRSRDPVAGTVYVLVLSMFAVMPVLAARRR